MTAIVAAIPARVPRIVDQGNYMIRITLITDDHFMMWAIVPERCAGPRIGMDKWLDEYDEFAGVSGAIFLSF